MAGGRRRPALPCAAALLLGVAPWCAGQSVYFEVLSFREPGQCERHQCMSARRDECRDHLEGYYLKEKGCPDGQICTRCTYPAANSTDPTICECENPPFSTIADYNQDRVSRARGGDRAGRGTVRGAGCGRGAVVRRDGASDL
ncbi:unnamed protein product [Prorocentrum cordatum]|uniref:Uncharacterized protein n=1 Tax=Prorocentrum cordatum TaxID=2364126 RepID=A0ABN9VLW0_9DINO|nr:unnamed protein product [Polarella glacialis]